MKHKHLYAIEYTTYSGQRRTNFVIEENKDCLKEFLKNRAIPYFKILSESIIKCDTIGWVTEDTTIILEGDNTL